MCSSANLKNEDQPCQDQLNPVDDAVLMFTVMSLSCGAWAVGTDLYTHPFSVQVI